MQVQDPRRGEEKAGEPKSTQSLKHCLRHIKARHARKKKGTTRPIPGFFLTTAKRAKPNETPVMQEAPVVQVPAVAQVAGGDVNLSGGLVLDDEDVIMQQRRASLSCRKRAPSKLQTTTRYEDDAPGEEEEEEEEDANEGDFLMSLEERTMGHQPRAARALASDIKLCGQTTERLIAGG